MNLNERPPRSPRVRLGGYVILPRMLDKCRAELAGNNGEYHYNCPLDQHFLNYAGIDAEALKTEVAKGLGDGEILKWINENSKQNGDELQVAQWSDFHDNRTPSDNEGREFFNSMLESGNAQAIVDEAGGACALGTG